MQDLIRKIKIAIKNRLRETQARNARELEYQKFLRVADMMTAEWPSGTSPHFIAYKLLRSKEELPIIPEIRSKDQQLDNRKYI